MGETAGQHRLVTVADFVAVVTDENVDDLALDFGEWLRWHLAVRPLAGVGLARMADDAFLWTDDGKQERRVTVTIASEDTTDD